MEPLKPRYEFRAWGEELTDVFTAIETHAELIGSRARIETYIVSRRDVGANPKVRDGVLDIKMMLGTVEGFEQWEPTVAMDFPLAADQVAAVLFDALHLPPTDLEREAYSLEHLIAEVIAPRKDVTALEVAKIRHAYEVHGCIVEVADVTVAGTMLQTAAVESAELDPLLVARGLIGLEGHKNMNYPQAIRKVLGW